MKYAPTHLDLFSGIGGFSLAFESEGFRTVGFSEIDPYASAVLRKHWPRVPNLGPIQGVNSARVLESCGQIDCLTAGFPCQPFSLAGKRNGDSDQRFLWPELARIIREIRPEFAVLENVPGLLSIDRGRIWNRILSDLVEIGYDCLWNCIPASSVGANHIRERVWVVAYLNGQGLSKLITPRKEQQSGSGFDRIHLPQSFPTCDPAETFIRRGVHGIPGRAHRIKCLGNAIVPQVAQIIARALYQFLDTQKS